jgi:hypothetical protein
MVMNIIRESQMWCLLFETQIEGLLCHESPNEDSESNSHGYIEELFKCVQHEESSPLIEKKIDAHLVMSHLPSRG